MTRLFSRFGVVPFARFLDRRFGGARYLAQQTVEPLYMQNGKRSGEALRLGNISQFIRRPSSQFGRVFGGAGLFFKFVFLGLRDRLEVKFLFFSQALIDGIEMHVHDAKRGSDRMVIVRQLIPIG